MSTSRDVVLGRIRNGLQRTDMEETLAVRRVGHTLASAEPNLVPARGSGDLEERIATFTGMARAVLTDVRRIAAWHELPALVGQYLREHNLPQKLVMAPDEALDRAGWDSQPLLRIRRDTAADADTTGVTLAEAGVAETGTLCLASSDRRPTLLAFFPETSIVVLPAADVVASYEEALERYSARHDAPPRSINFVTGPSRTGDIGQKLELGAHGPRRLLVVLIDEA
ncbi:MAG: lactate utilization protein [Geminicoccaceae bacterium]|nr:lactate utilization protein [Geminicoccaceae bacterium]